MSTKTLRKRIALVAVTALGAGLLSVVPVSSANAAVENVAAGTATNPAIAEANTLQIATVTTTSGSTAAIAASTTAIASDPAEAAAIGMGLVNVSDIAGGLVAGTTQTATLLSNGALSVYTSTTSGQFAAITVDGGTISANTGAYLAPSAKLAVSGAQSAVSNWGVVAKPSSGSTTMTIRLYSGYAYATSASASITAVATAPTALTLSGQITVTVAATSVAGVLAASKSGVYYSSSSTDGANTEDATSGTWKDKAPTTQFANIRVRDAYGSDVGVGLLQATATGGALVNITDTTGSAGTASSAFYTSAADDTMLTVSAPSFAPLTTTVTVSFNGTVVGTKSFTFTGPVAAITLGAALRINNQSTTTGTASGKGATISFTDSAGSAIYVGSSSTGMTNYASSGFLVSAASDRSGILSVAPSTSTTTGYVDWGCNGSSATTDNLIVSYVNVDGSVVTSQPLKVSCAGSPYTFTVGYDKASYSPGEIATLSVSFKDSKGNAANDITAWSTSAPVITVGGGALSTATTTSDASALGVKKYSILTIVTEGTYQTVVSLPTVTSSNSSQKEMIAGFTLKSQSAGVSNADVLKSIVSLIASINKQIQALQKLILKR
jgi:hypothetical protein